MSLFGDLVPAARPSYALMAAVVVHMPAGKLTILLNIEFCGVVRTLFGKQARIVLTQSR